MTRASFRPLSARSVIASTLLGTHPPKLPGRMLVAVTARFGISDGAARVALSRMADNGELVNVGGTYALHGHLLDRQARQDASRAASTLPWDGAWDQAIVVGPASEQAHRQSRRATLIALKLGELRDGIWLRPTNLPRSLESLDGTPDVLFASALPKCDPQWLVTQLWDMEAWSTEAQHLLVGLEGAASGLDADDDRELRSGFELSAAVLRHMVADPELPVELCPPGWPARELRETYDSFDAAYRRLLARFLQGAA